MELICWVLYNFKKSLNSLGVILAHMSQKIHQSASLYLEMQKVLLLPVSSSVHSLLCIQASPMHCRALPDWLIHNLWNLYHLFLKYSKAMSCSFHTKTVESVLLSCLWLAVDWTVTHFPNQTCSQNILYVTHKLMSMTHIGHSLSTSKRTFQKGRGGGRSLSLGTEGVTVILLFPSLPSSTAEK